MNILLQLKEKLQELIDDINVGLSDLTNEDVCELLDHVNLCCGKVKYYKADLAFIFSISIKELNFLISTHQIPQPFIDDDGIEFWYKKDIKDVIHKMESC